MRKPHVRTREQRLWWLWYKELRPARRAGSGANVAPVWTSGTSLVIPENSTGTIYVCVATDATSVTYSIVGGVDAARFSLSGSNLSFTTSPDYENPTDSNADNIYQVTLRASDGTLYSDINLSITVTNVLENTVPGVGLTLVSPLNTPLTAGSLIGTITGRVSGDDITLGGADASQFVLNGAKTEARVGATDITSAGSRSITLTQSKPDAASVTNNFTVSVTTYSPVTGDIIAARIAADGFTVELDILGFKPGGNKTRGRAASGSVGSYSGGANDTVQYNLSPYSTPKLVLSTSNRSGFTSTGSPTSSLTETFYGTVSRRNPYSAANAHWTNDETDNTTYLTVRILLDKQVFAGETITLNALTDIYLDNGTGGSGLSSRAASNLTVTNNSTATAPLPVLDWLTVPKQRIGSGDITLELLASHFAGRQGRMLAAAVITMTGATSGYSVTKTITQMSIPTSMVRSGTPKGNVFAATFTSSDVAGFTQGETVNVTVEGRPWIGSAFVSTTHGAAYPNVNMAQSIPFVIDKNDTLRAWATVDPSGSLTGASTAGCNWTATENTNPANCYANIDHAMTALYTFMGRSELAHGVVWVRAGTYATFGGTTSTTSKPNGMGWIEVTRAPSTSSAADVTITTTAGQTVTNRKIGGNVKFSNMTLASVASATAGDNIFFYGPDSTATPSKYIWLDNCAITGGINTAGTPSAFLHQIGMAYWTNNNVTRLDGSSAKVSLKSAAGRGYPLLAGNIFNGCGQIQPYVLVCCTLTGGSYFQTPGTTATIPQPTQMRVDYTQWSGTGNNTLHHYGSATASMPNGSSFVSCVLESFSGTSNPAIQISADRDKNVVDRQVSAYSLVTGQRQNYLYNSEGTVAVSKRGSRRFCIYAGNQDASDDTYFIKSDTFADTFTTPGQQAGRIGNWITRASTDSLNNVRLEESFTQDFASPIGEVGDFDARTNATNPGVISRVGVFINDQSGTSHSGGGNYRLAGASNPLYNLVPAGLAMLAFDNDGNPRLNDGTGAIGAYERTL